MALELNKKYAEKKAKIILQNHFDFGERLADLQKFNHKIVWYWKGETWFMFTESDAIEEQYQLYLKEEATKNNATTTVDVVDATQNNATLDKTDDLSDSSDSSDLIKSTGYDPKVYYCFGSEFPVLISFSKMETICALLFKDDNYEDNKCVKKHKYEGENHSIYKLMRMELKY
jgi:hypothetical protein